MLAPLQCHRVSSSRKLVCKYLNDGSLINLLRLIKHFLSRRPWARLRWGRRNIFHFAQPRSTFCLSNLTRAGIVMPSKHMQPKPPATRLQNSAKPVCEIISSSHALGSSWDHGMWVKRSSSACLTGLLAIFIAFRFVRWPPKRFYDFFTASWDRKLGQGRWRLLCFVSGYRRFSYRASEKRGKSIDEDNSVLWRSAS